MRWAVAALVATALWAIVGTAGCTALHPQWPREGWSFREGPAHVTVARDVPVARHARLRAAVRAHQAAFTRDHGADAVVAHALGLVDDDLGCGVMRERKFSGCTIGRTVLLSTGAPWAPGTPPDSLPSYYHELFHLHVPLDLVHGDPRWPEVDRRGAEVWRSLR